MGKVKCLECGEILESTYRHDFRMCSCPNKTFVDGGDAYLRCGGKKLHRILILNEDGTSELADEPPLYEKECNGG